MATSFPSEKNSVSSGLSYLTWCGILSFRHGSLWKSLHRPNKTQPTLSSGAWWEGTLLRGVWDVGLIRFSSPPRLWVMNNYFFRLHSKYWLRLYQVMITTISIIIMTANFCEHLPCVWFGSRPSSMWTHGINTATRRGRQSYYYPQFIYS